jgi:hypothetical protein
MVEMIARKLKIAGIASLGSLFVSAYSQAQSQISLQPLVPATANPATTMPVPVRRSAEPEIMLTAIPKASQAGDVAAKKDNDPVKLKELKPAQDKPNKLLLETKMMIGQPIDQFSLFSKVNALSDLQEPAVPAATVRGQMFDPMSTYDWTPTGYCWQSPAFCYSPLYFEQPNLERYGTGPDPWFAPVASASYFYGQLVAFPIRVVHQPWWSKDCTLGHHRPGDCVPHQRRITQHNLNHMSNSNVVATPNAQPGSSMPVEESSGLAFAISPEVLASQPTVIPLTVQASATIALPPPVQAEPTYPQVMTSQPKAEVRKIFSE